MKKLFMTAIAALTLVTASAAKREFTVTSANVDGLPPNVHIEYLGFKKDISMNPDGSQERGATQMGKLIANHPDWDIIALSEDFNYHTSLMEPCKTYFRASTYRGKVEQENLKGRIPDYFTSTETNFKVYVNTDGLCLLSRKKNKVYDEKIVGWKQKYGYNHNQNDGLIDKGYRSYTVKLDGGEYYVDIYILHMDAGSYGDEDTTNDDNVEPQGYGNERARTAQLKQLAAAIINSDNKRPIIILGDTNCRYTRDSLKEDLIDAINADSRFEIHDTWVDSQWDGVYPELGAGAIMTSQYGEQRGEVVDKVFYINNSEADCQLTFSSYLHDTSFTYDNGEQISDHFPIVCKFEIEGPDTPEPEPVVYPEAPEKGAIVSGQTYYIRNLATGQFICAGGKWNTQAILRNYGTAITPILKSGSTYTLGTPYGSKYIRKDGTYYWMDQTTADWALTQVKDNIYTIVDAAGDAIGHDGNIVSNVTANPSDLNQQWEFLTKADLLHELYYAKPTDPKDATFLMTNPDFIKSWDGWSPSSKGYQKNEISTNSENEGSIGRFYWGSWSMGDNIFSMNQTVSGLPAGKYRITYQTYTHNLVPGNKTGYTINGEIAPWSDSGTGKTDPGKETVLQKFAKGEFTHTMTLTITNESTYANKIVINVNKAKTSSACGAYFDNFQIECLGLTGYDFDEVPYERVRAAIEDTQNKADDLGVMIDNSGVEYLCENYEIVGDGWDQVEQCYKNLGKAMLTLTEIPCDYTYAIVNPGFEQYLDYTSPTITNLAGKYPFGWTYRTEHAQDSGVWPADDQYKQTDNAEGTHIFNTWANDWGGYALQQEIALTPGIYELSAMVTSDPGNKVYLYAGDAGTYKACVEATDKATLVPVKMSFRVTDGKPVAIGVTGSDSNGNLTFNNGRWYKADDFRLTRVGDEAMIQGIEMLKYAIPDVAEKSKKYVDGGLDLSKYQDMVDNYTLRGDGTAEFVEIYGLLRELVFAQQGDNIDLTDAIINPSFEWGNYYGWETEVVDVNETGVKPTNGGYQASGSHGSYLFNTWSNHGAKEITQVLYGMPAGKYELKALVSSNDNGSAFISANGLYESVATKGDKTMIEGSLVFNVAADNTNVTIGIYPQVGGNYNPGNYGDWYKADNFRLVRLSGEADMTEFYEALQAAVDDVTAKAALLPEPYCNNLDLSGYQAMIDEKSLEGDGSAEIAEVYSLFKALVLSQVEAGADMTLAIDNNDFETGTLTGWTYEAIDDTGAKPTKTNPYTVDNDNVGNWLFNTWNGDNWGSDLSQVIPALHAGIYRLDALVSSRTGYEVQLFAGDDMTSIIATDGGTMDDASVEFVITDDDTDITIGTRGINTWYKADEFHLTLVASFTELDEVISPVTTYQQLVPGATFYIMARHDSGHHALASTGDRGMRALGGEEGISHLADASAFTLVKNGTKMTLTPAEAASIMPMAVDDSELTVTLPVEGADAVITSGDAVLGFHPTDKTFGTSEEHSIPARLFTAAYDETLTGVDDVIADGYAADALYYNLQGMRIDRPAAGTVCIKVAAGKATKVVVK